LRVPSFDGDTDNNREEIEYDDIGDSDEREEGDCAFA
jgi:hypothetical protein